ncbi:MAG: EamA family transporter [Kordia sp.]|nr:MAG: EamA family transporter [Kordia sp.]
MNSKLWMLLSVLTFCIVAIGVKQINTDVSPFQIIFFRALIGSITLLILLPKKTIIGSLSNIKQHLFRNLFHLIAQYGWVLGIVYLSLAEVTAIEFTTPIWILILASLFIKEKITTKKVISIVLGFIGVLIIMKPGIELINYNSIIVLLSAICFAIAHTATKKIVKTNSASDVVIIMCLTQLPISFACTYANWNWPNYSDYFWLILIGLSGIGAHFSLAKALKKEDISSLISLDYLRLPILILAGILFYNEAFDTTIIIGGTLIFIGNYINQKKSNIFKINTKHSL